ncbi:hypothetical protein [Primorskyibacter flagellatus]|uniref:Uncharacterized protein n=1 Tax=Primorskyibacter flagellatus TaxID=1387277 RepID=A0A1W1Z9Z9_9RHOB|nr:hypothetical protein [Primorskyibacter flagellatus]SMC45260.1 hypothetical protein SAMN06295998_101377 [Primorskyibacter flagellatus]
MRRIGNHPTRQFSEVAKTGALLAAIVLHNLIYPLSTGGGVGPLIFYAVYASIFVAGTWALTADARWRVAALGSGVAVFAAGVVNSYAGSGGVALAVYLTSIAYHAVMIVVLVRYTFTARTVMTEVILAATSLTLCWGRYSPPCSGWSCGWSRALSSPRPGPRCNGSSFSTTATSR